MNSEVNVVHEVIDDKREVIKTYRNGVLDSVEYVHTEDDDYPTLEDDEDSDNEHKEE